MTVTLFGRATCAPCKTVKYWLEKKGIDFTYQDIDLEPAQVNMVPTIVVGEQVIEGMNLSLLSKALVV